MRRAFRVGGTGKALDPSSLVEVSGACDSDQSQIAFCSSRKK